METSIEIFDKDGKALHIGDVIGRFLIEQTEKHEGYDIEDTQLGLENYHDEEGKQRLALYDPEYEILDEIWVNAI